jgi:hypothetical protein
MESVVRISIKNVYGNETVYPECALARGFAAIAGTKTLTRAVLCQIEAMGFSLVVSAPVLSRGVR